MQSKISVSHIDLRTQQGQQNQHIAAADAHRVAESPTTRSDERAYQEQEPAAQ